MKVDERSREEGWSANLHVLACVAQDSVVVLFNNSLLDINHALHLYYKRCMWIEFQSIST